MTLGSKVDNIRALRDKRSELEAQIKELNEEITAAESELIEAMDAEKCIGASGAKASAKIEEKVFPNIEDWDAFMRFIARNKYNHLVERRPSVSGCRELFESGRSIPGIVRYTKRAVRITKLS